MARAAVLDHGTITVTDIADPIPARGQVLVRTLACGICGSDLHRAAASRHDDQPCLILGHEFCAEILGYGPHTDGPIPIGGRVVSFPYIEGPKGLEVLGFTPDYPGGFSDRMVLGIDDLVAVPNGLSPTLAALTEPMAVGEHAVALATPAPGDVAMVIGCGPVGLAVILALRRRGTDPIIAVDFSPQRRLLAERIGADMTIDPKRESPYDSWGKFGIDGQDALALLAYAARKTPKRSLIFDCVGAPGIIGSIVNGAPLGATVVVVGACAQEDRFIPLRALTKELQLRFANAYTHDEFAMTLRRIADGGLDPSPILTREIGIEDIDDAFAALASPEEAKIVIRHR